MSSLFDEMDVDNIYLDNFSVCKPKDEGLGNVTPIPKLPEGTFMAQKTDMISFSHIPLSSGNTSIIYKLEFAFKLLDKPIEEISEDLDPHTIVDVVASYIVCFKSLKSYDEEESKEDLKEFGQAYAPITAWPYFRELVQSSIQKLGYNSSVVLPMMKVKLVPQPISEVK